MHLTDIDNDLDSYIIDLKSFNTYFNHFIENVESSKYYIFTIKKVINLIQNIYKEIDKDTKYMTNYISNNYDNLSTDNESNETNSSNENNTDDSIDDKFDNSLQLTQYIRKTRSKTLKINYDNPKLNKFIEGDYNYDNILYYKKTDKSIKKINKFIKNINLYY